MGWIIFLEGGDFCGYGNTSDEQLENCYEASKTELGSSKRYLKRPSMRMGPNSPLFDHEPATNKLSHDWNWVYIPYLDGGYYAGMREDTPVVKGRPLHFRGAFNLKAIVSSLVEIEGFGGATEVVFSGCSSGGVAVIANADHLHDLVKSVASPDAHIAAFVDSGYYLHINTVYWTKPVLHMQHIGATLNAHCQAALQDSPWDCIVAEVAAPYVENLNLFVWESRYDSNQLDCVQIDPKNVSGVNAYGAQLQNSILAWSSSHGKAARSAFVDACSRHCYLPGASIKTGGGLTPLSAFASWYSSTRGGGNTTAIVQQGVYPCKTCCDVKAHVVV